MRYITTNPPALYPPIIYLETFEGPTTMRDGKMYLFMYDVAEVHEAIGRDEHGSVIWQVTRPAYAYRMEMPHE